MRKKAEVSTGFLIGIVILVISFVAILFFALSVDFNTNIDREACHQSIVFRATAKVGFIDASEAIPLNCKTEKICLSMSGQDCFELTNTEENRVNKIKLNSDPVKAKEEIKDIFVDRMVSCHSMLGEGKLNFMPNDLASFSDTKYGLICSRIVFDEQVKSEVEDISYAELYAQLGKKGVSSDQGEISALEYLYPGWRNSANSIKLFQTLQESDDNLKNIDPVNWKVDLRQENGYSVISAIATQGQGWPFAKAIGAAAIPLGGALIATGIGAPVGATLLIGGTASVATGSAVLWYDYGNEYRYFPPFVYPYDINVLREVGIYSFEIAP